MSVGNDNKHVGLPWDASLDESLVNGVIMRAAINCPMCGWETKQILYGLPVDRNAVSDEVVLGGCVIDDLSPELTCSNCNWSGQEWHIGAPLPPTVWIIMDPDGLRGPIGVTAGRYDQIYETFLFGYWHSINSTQQYQDWFEHLFEEPLVLRAAFDDLSPGVIAEFRMGREPLSFSDLISAGLVQVAGKAPRLNFDEWTNPFPRLQG